MRPMDCGEAIQPILGAAGNHPAPRLRLQNSPRIGTSQKPPFDPIKPSSWHSQSGNSSWYPAEVLWPQNSFLLTCSPWKFVTVANPHHLQVAPPMLAGCSWPLNPVFFAPYLQSNSSANLFYFQVIWLAFLFFSLPSYSTFPLFFFFFCLKSRIPNHCRNLANVKRQILMSCILFHVGLICQIFYLKYFPP